jgi:DNA-binding CsgD family transcriptional regulator
LSPPVLRAFRAAGAALPHDEVITYALTDRLPGKSADQGGLTPREYQVAELVAQGFTNAQIATRLSMSARTVASHLSHIRAALNLPSRVHVARWFNEHTVS